jgi:hypothetical protein
VTLNDVTKFGAEVGFSLTGELVDLSAGNYWDIEFCRSRPVWTEDGWTMCRHPDRALACFGVSHRFSSLSVSDYMRYVKGIAECEAHASYNLPMLPYLADAVLDRVGGRSIYSDEDLYRGGVKLDITKLRRKPIQVHPVTRVHVELAFGVSAEQQQRYEDSVGQLVTNVLLTPPKYEMDVVVNRGQHLWLRP